MLNLNQRYQDLMKDLESHIENKNDLEYVKNSFSNLFLDFLNDMQEIVKGNEGKLQQLEEKQKQLDVKSSKLESSIQKIEKDIYINDNYDFEIVCPYCNFEFETEFDELKDQIHCPECNNVIELDWNEEGCSGDCSSGCGGCHGIPDEEETTQDDSKEENNEDDDM